MRFLVFVILFGLACGASISPVEIAEARQRCTTQCSNPNHVEAAACMRQCWATFFAERKAGRRQVHPPKMPFKGHSPVVKARTPVAVKAPFAPHRSGAPAKKVAHKSRSVTHAHVRARHARSSGHKLVGMGAVLIAMVFLLM